MELHAGMQLGEGQKQAFYEYFEANWISYGSTAMCTVQIRQEMPLWQSTSSAAEYKTAAGGLSE